MRVFIDANIPMYAAGKIGPYKDPCKEILAQVALGKLDGITDVEVFQEILYRYYHIRESALGHRIFADFRTAVDSVLPVCAADVFRAHDLAEQYPQVPPRDLLHAAVMKNNGLAQILSADRDFDAIEGIERLDPIDWLEASIAAQKDEDDV